MKRFDIFLTVSKLIELIDRCEERGLLRGAGIFSINFQFEWLSKFHTVQFINTVNISYLTSAKCKEIRFTFTLHIRTSQISFRWHLIVNRKLWIKNTNSMVPMYWISSDSIYGVDFIFYRVNWKLNRCKCDANVYSMMEGTCRSDRESIKNLHRKIAVKFSTSSVYN